MAAEFVVALLLSVLGVFTLPRTSVRVRYAVLDAKGRLQFWLLSGGSIISAISLWFDIALQARNHGKSFFPVIAVAAGLWILLLAGTEIPSLWNGRSVTLLGVPAGFSGGRALYRGVLRGIPAIGLALVLLQLGVLANIVAANGLVGGVFRVLLMFSLGASLLGLCAVVFGQPQFLVPPPLRGDPGLIQSLFSKGRESGRRS